MQLLRPFATWLFRLHGPERGEVVLVQRRIFILPTRAGLGFAAVLLLMLTGSINYALSLGFILTFLLGGLAVVAMLHTFRNLAGLRVTAGKAEPVFAGDLARFPITLRNPTRTPRFGLVVARDKHDHDIVDVPAESASIATASIPAERRGLLYPGRLTLYTRYPLALYRGWSYVELDTHCVVYPRPAAAGRPPPRPPPAAALPARRCASRPPRCARSRRLRPDWLRPVPEPAARRADAPSPCARAPARPPRRSRGPPARPDRPRRCGRSPRPGA
jgi:hypothetical protein